MNGTQEEPQAFDQITDNVPLASVESFTEVNTSSKPQENSDAIKVAKQAKQLFHEKGKRWDALFYKIVLGGSTNGASQVMDHQLYSQKC